MPRRSVACALIIILSLSIVLSGCGNNKVIDGVKYGRFGLVNKDDKMNPDIQYEVIWGNVFLSFVLLETVVGPFYFLGFDLFEPVGPKPKIKGQVTH